jgi:hypothetical protein
MLLLQAIFLWLIVAGLMLSGAYLFHRLFPRESPWFAFLLPVLMLVVACNFIEHLVELRLLLVLLPLLLAPLLLLVTAPGAAREKLLLPAGVFLGSFAFTFGVRCLQPDINYTSDGLSDLNMVNNYLQGGTLPPLDTWMPPFHHAWYYSLQHYGASVAARLLNVKAGVAYNVCHGLLSALICVAGAATAWRLSGGRLWITLAVPFLIEGAATGSSAYIHLAYHNPSMWLAFDPSGGFDDASVKDTALWKFLGYFDQHHEILRLQVPGFWTWRDEFHANASGHFLALLSVFVIAELAAVGRTLWPWVMAGIIPMLAVTASAWALPITLLLCGGAVLLALWSGRRPASVPQALTFFFIGATLLWPAFYNATSSPAVPPTMWTEPLWRVPLSQFLVQWWPLIALWIGGLILWRRIDFGVRWVIVVVPVMLIAIELVTIESRYNTIEKMWGYTWGAGLAALFPVVAVRTHPAARVLTGVLIFSAVVSLGAFVRTMVLNLGPDAFHLEGDHYLTFDVQKRRLLETMSARQGLTFLSGKSDWCYNEAPALATFTNNRSYIAWYWFESLTDYQDEANYRHKLDTDFYSGAMTGRLQFLEANHIDGVVIWPDDNLADDYLDGLKKELATDYDYIDCKADGPKNAGLFLRRGM